MPNAQRKRKKSQISKSFLMKISTILVTGIALPIACTLWKTFIRNGFSLKVNILFLVSLAIFVIWIVLVDVYLLKKEKEETKGHLVKILLYFTILLIISSLWLTIEFLEEPEKGTLVVRIRSDSTYIPEKISIRRNFPKWLSFLNTQYDLEFDFYNRAFSTTKLIRCGEWSVFLHPYHQYEPVKTAYNIPSEEPYTARAEILCRKKICHVIFKTFDENGKPIAGAEIQIYPEPYDFESHKTTPCRMNIEMGTYTIKFRLDGYQDSDPIVDLTFLPDEEIVVKGILRRLPPDENDPKKQNVKSKKRYINHSKKILIPEVEIKTKMENVAGYIEQGNLKAAEILLKEIIEDFPGSSASKTAKNILDEIQQDAEELLNKIHKKEN
jgi:hypothetical protein